MTESDTMTKAEMQLVVFDLTPEAYGVDIGTVREIIRVQEITHVPNAPDFVEGVINLRGKVIPVVDLRKRFGLAAHEETKDSRIVVVDIGGEDIGIRVDAVTEVLRISADTVAPASSIITTADSYYILGIAKLGERLIILLNLDKVLSQEEKLALVETKAPAKATAKAAAA
jgi:purine-binding chemotaxis protein CheW